MSVSALKPQIRQDISCVVVQIGRLGDLFQCLMALKATQQLYPQLKFHLLVKDEFVNVVKKVSWIENVSSIPTDSILEQLENKTITEKEAVQAVAKHSAELVSRRWDLVINWSYTEASSYITALIPAKVKLGYSRRKDLSFLSTDGWSNYVQAVLQGGIEQNIHFTDILTTQFLTALQIHFGEPVDPGNATVTSRTFFEFTESDHDERVSALDPTKRWIALQLDNEHNYWPKLIERILTSHNEAHIVLLGKSDLISKISPNFISKGRIVDLTGIKDFSVWANAIAKSQWLIAHDTPAVHLASLVGTRVLSITEPQKIWQQGGPYGTGHYILSKSNTELDAETIYTVWSYAYTEWAHRRNLSLTEQFEHISSIEKSLDISVYRTRIRASDLGGGLVLDDLFDRPLTIQNWNAQVMGHIARAWYCGWTPKVALEVSPEKLTPELIRNLRKVEEASSVMIQICEESSRTAKEIKKLTAALASESIMPIENKSMLRELSSKLIELDSLCERLSKAAPQLKFVPAMSKVLMHNIPGSKISEISHESSEAYELLTEAVQIIQQWAHETLRLSRPRAIAPKPNRDTEVTL